MSMWSVLGVYMWGAWGVLAAEACPRQRWAFFCSLAAVFRCESTPGLG